ncbi:hypothetical protein HOD08_00355, partial [bacterium]|nr:hypothetical protein [bacterium]
MQLGSHRIEFPPEFRDRCKRVVLPSIFTLLNATCGFLSLIAVLRGNLRIAAELILVAAVMDFFDG